MTDDYISLINYELEQHHDAGHSIKDVSDGHHTFGELYWQRMILTQIIAESYPDAAWKSKQHADGTMFDGDFIVGFTTPAGQYSYHYKLQYWDDFDIKELPKAPAYDGHCPDDISRLLSLLPKQY